MIQNGSSGPVAGVSPNTVGPPMMQSSSLHSRLASPQTQQNNHFNSSLTNIQQSLTNIQQKLIRDEHIRNAAGIRSQPKGPSAVTSTSVAMPSPGSCYNANINDAALSMRNLGNIHHAVEVPIINSHSGTTSMPFNSCTPSPSDNNAKAEQAVVGAQNHHNAGSNGASSANYFEQRLHKLKAARNKYQAYLGEKSYENRVEELYGSQYLNSAHSNSESPGQREIRLKSSTGNVVGGPAINPNEQHRAHNINQSESAPMSNNILDHSNLNKSLPKRDITEVLNSLSFSKEKENDIIMNKKDLNSQSSPLGEGVPMNFTNQYTEKQALESLLGVVNQLNSKSSDLLNDFLVEKNYHAESDVGYRHPNQMTHMSNPNVTSAAKFVDPSSRGDVAMRGSEDHHGHRVKNLSNNTATEE